MQFACQIEREINDAWKIKTKAMGKGTQTPGQKETDLQRNELLQKIPGQKTWNKKGKTKVKTDTRQFEGQGKEYWDQKNWKETWSVQADFYKDKKHYKKMILDKSVMTVYNQIKWTKLTL